MMACVVTTPAALLFLLVLAEAPAVQPGVEAGADTLVSAFVVPWLLLRVLTVPVRINRKRPPSGSSYCARAVNEHGGGDDDNDDEDDAELVGSCVSLYDAATYLTLLMLLMLLLLLLFLLFLLMLLLWGAVMGDALLLYWVSCHDCRSDSSWDSAVWVMLLPVAPEVSSPSLLGSPLPATAAAAAGVVLPAEVDGSAEVVLALVSVSLRSMSMMSMAAVVEGGATGIGVALVSGAGVTTCADADADG